jgi:tetratricopeptide (TPR) repeat protein
MRIFLYLFFRVLLLLTLLLPFSPVGVAQNADAQKLPTVTGSIYDSEKHALPGVELDFQGARDATPVHTLSDSQGDFRVALPAGIYTLRTKRDGYRQVTEGPFEVLPGEAKRIVLHLAKAASSAADKEAAAMPFSDEPQFTVAGVTDSSALGVHASSRNMPNSNAIAKETSALDRETSNLPDESAIRAQLAAGENAELHFTLAEIEEAKGHSLESAKEYERAAQLQPTEAHLFGWGAELLLHLAYEPALDVFSKAHQRYPESVRMLLGLGATKYALGSREEAARYFSQASDLEPSNPQPYLFLGRLLSTETTVPGGWLERMHRFAILHHETARAHYFYGLALAKGGAPDAEAESESEFRQAIELDPHLGEAYLDLGILYSKRSDFPSAIDALRNAIRFTALPDEAHYRLAEVYRRTGEAEKARQETALYKQVSEQKSQQAERERHEIQQFIYTLRDSKSAPPATSDPH